MFVENTVWDTLLRAMLLTVMALGWIVIVVRVVGLRAFSKMTAFDFVVTLAIGSLLASCASASDWPGFVQGLVAIAVLLAWQVVLARLRRRSRNAAALLENQPTLLVRDGVFLEDAMQRERVARSDILAKMREGNVARLSDVRAVVLETTGDISILHGQAIDPVVLEGVRGA